MAGSTPATLGITFAHGGGTMAGMVVHWPKGIKAKGEKRRQYHHLIDIVPTVLDAVGVPEPKVVNGVQLLPMPGVSMRYSFDDANAKDGYLTQYTEVHGNRSIYHDGWLAATIHSAFWEPDLRTTEFSKDKWELYNAREDVGQANDLAAQSPQKLEEKKVGEGRVEKTMGTLYSLAAETADIGRDGYSPVTTDYDAWDNAFTGTIQKISVQLN